MVEPMSQFEAQAKFKLDQMKAILDTLKLETDETLVYAIAQLFQDKLDELNDKEEKIGEIVSNVVNSLIEFNRPNLTLYNHYMQTILDEKQSTLH